MTSEAKRKTVHIGSAAFALLLAWITWWQAAGLALAALIFNLFVLPRIGGKGLYRKQDHQRGYALGILAYPISVLFFLFLFRERLHLTALCWGLLAFGDGFASLAGRRWGRAEALRLPWNREKSWAGLAAYLIAGGVGAGCLCLWVAPDLSLSRLCQLLLPVLVLGAFLESWETGLDDNLTTSFVTAMALLVTSGMQWSALSSVARSAGTDWLWAAAGNAALGILAWLLRSVDWSGLIGGFLLGCVLWVFGGWECWILLVLFFVLGSTLTKLGRRRKESLGAAQEKGGRRSARHAWANGGTAAWLALGIAGATSGGTTTILLVALAGAFATAAHDTASSEGGMAWGRTAFLLTRGTRVPPGTEGAVSLEGTACGTVAGAAVGAAGALLGLYPPLGIGVVAVGALLGGLAESLLGAWTGSDVDNEFLNLLNTMFGAGITAAIWLLVR